MAIQTPRIAKTGTRVLTGHRDQVLSVSFSCDGRRLASGGGRNDKAIRIYNPERTDFELKAHSEQVMQVCWDPSHPDRFASTSYDKTTKLWDFRRASPFFPALTHTEAKATATFTGPDGNMNMTWSPDGRWLAVGDRSDTISLYSATEAKLATEQKQDLETNELAFTNNSQGLICARGYGQVRILSTPTLDEAYTWVANTAGLLAIDVDPRGRTLAVGGHDTLISLWDLKDLACVKIISALDGPVRSLRFSHDGVFLATASEDNMINIYNAETGDQAHSISTPQWGTALAWNPVRHVLAYTYNGPEPFAHGQRGPQEYAIRVYGL